MLPKLALVVAALSASPAVADLAELPVHPAVSVGVGTGYNLLGVRGELRAWRVSAYAALGEGLQTIPPISRYDAVAAPSFAFGVQYVGGAGQGLLASANVNLGSFRYWHDAGAEHSNYNCDGSFATVTLTLGWRFRFFGHGFFDLAAGGGRMFVQDQGTGPEARPGPTQHRWSWIPDGALGLGVEL